MKCKVGIFYCFYNYLIHGSKLRFIVVSTFAIIVDKELKTKFNYAIFKVAHNFELASSALITSFYAYC